MDLINGMLAIKQSNLNSQVQMTVARKMLDNQEMQGAAAIQLIEAAGNVGAGDPLVAAATGLGGAIDTYG
jgi:hypothetical protein